MAGSYDGLDMLHELKKYDLYAVFEGKPFAKILLGRLRMRRKDNIKIWLIVIGCNDVKWVELIQDCYQCLVLVLVVLILQLWVCQK